MERRLFRCEPDDPRRCQARVQQGQCPFLSVEGTSSCPMHGGVGADGAHEEKSKRIYRLTKYRARVGELADHDQIKSLREEIGVLRMMLEEIINRCKDDSDLLIYSSKISDLVMKVEKLVSSCHRLELSTGALLDKAAVLQLASAVVEIISRHVDDQDLVSDIADEILVAVSQTRIDPKRAGKEES